MNQPSASEAKTEYSPPLGRAPEVGLALFDLGYAVFVALFWVGALISLGYVHDDAVREKIAEMKRVYDEKAELYRKYGDDLPEEDRARIEELTSGPVSDPLAAYEVLSGPKIYYPALLFALWALAGNVLLLWTSLARITMRRTALKWLKFTLIFKLLGLAAGMAVYLLISGPALFEMLAALERGLVLYNEYHGRVYDADLVSAAKAAVWCFIALMLLWPGGTFLVLLGYRKAREAKMDPKTGNPPFPEK